MTTKFYCKGKKGYCHNFDSEEEKADCTGCEFFTGEGGEVITVKSFVEFDSIQHALKKQTPMKPTPRRTVPKITPNNVFLGSRSITHTVTVYTCSCCGEYIKRIDKYCNTCGQKIDWSDV